jgi:hypothetical protein
MKKIVALTALLVLATMPSVPQRVYACGSGDCARPGNASEPANSAA